MGRSNGQRHPRCLGSVSESDPSMGRPGSKASPIVQGQYTTRQECGQFVAAGPFLTLQGKHKQRRAHAKRWDSGIVGTVERLAASAARRSTLPPFRVPEIPAPKRSNLLPRSHQVGRRHTRNSRTPPTPGPDDPGSARWWPRTATVGVVGLDQNMMAHHSPSLVLHRHANWTDHSFRAIMCARNSGFLRFLHT